ncbi:nitroreductase [Candidatus Nomurabacteria bacterium RIFCSPHIGHO2_01_FULL_39_10]|uniref:Nitroreductase n=1 Tax=Candidatus Nomurabacteria bacterium RIFCSPHIGHO2_01_FULL_39_10 TaxID=1801733 RepID=A0A1F6V6J8_9BACT|nr:MAG: nitroreductase [Candidatus Nomurabacteria bacterium RIFCSPHIGHO2_01_FULL_39_10]
MKLQSIAKKIRKPMTSNTDISPLFYTRWSPRAMSGESIPKEELLPLFEAARWAPSSYNNQPWRFIIATGEQKEKCMDFLIDFNKQWCKNAAALIIILSAKNFTHNNQPAQTHSFDTGAAWMSLALEGARRNLVVHGMQGFDYDKVKQTLQIPDTYQVEAMCAIGKFAKKSVLPKDMQDKEKPSGRKEVSEFVNWEGKFEWG